MQNTVYFKTCTGKKVQVAECCSFHHVTHKLYVINWLIKYREHCKGVVRVCLYDQMLELLWSRH